MEESDKDTLDSKDVLFGNELETEGESLWETFRRKFKFCLILFSYAAAFYSMITFGYWLVDTSVTASPEFQKTFSETTVFSEQSFTLYYILFLCMNLKLFFLLESIVIVYRMDGGVDSE